MIATIIDSRNIYENRMISFGDDTHLMEPVMQYSTFEELKPHAHVTKVDCPTRWQLRRNRLNRLARLVESAKGPLEMFHGIEYMPEESRDELRSANSPFALAFADEELRIAGLAGDDYRSGVAFFQLAPREAHHILCDCHLAVRPSPQVVAQRIRMIAERRTLPERFANLRNRINAWFN